MPKSVDAIDSELDHLRNRVDAMEEEAAAKGKGWLRRPSNVLAILAFAVSLITTGYSFFHTQEQDVHSLRTELRGIMQRLLTIPRENAEERAKYKDDPNMQIAITNYLTQENNTLCLQANDILRRLPANEISSYDFLIVSQAFIISNRYDQALANAEKGLTLAAGVDEKIFALRTIAQLQMAKGDKETARRTFAEALEIFPEYGDFAKRAMAIRTEIFWATSEAGAREFGEAQKHAARAQEVVAGMAAGEGADFWRNQVQGFLKMLEAAQKGPGEITSTLGRPGMIGHPASEAIAPQ